MYGAYVAAAMKKAGVDASELARRVGYSSPDMIYKIVKDKASPSLEALDGIADALGLRIGDLLPNSGGGVVEDRFQPLLAAMTGLDDDGIDEMVLRLSEIARQMRGWRLREPIRVPAGVEVETSQRAGAYNGGNTDTPSAPPGLRRQFIDEADVPKGVIAHAPVGRHGTKKVGPK